MGQEGNENGYGVSPRPPLVYSSPPALSFKHCRYLVYSYASSGLELPMATLTLPPNAEDK